MEYIYATLTLNELDQELNQENITAVLEAAGCDVIESRVKAIVAALEDVDLAEIGTDAGIAPAPSPDANDGAEDATSDGDESAYTGDVDADSDASDAVDAASVETDEPLEADAEAAGETDTPEPSTASPESGSGDGDDEVSSAGTADPGTGPADDPLETDGGASNDESGAE